MKYTVSASMLENGFTVPNDIADKHLRLVGGEQIKVLLLLLRHPGKDWSTDDISSKLKLTREEVEDCLQYWILTGVIAESGSTDDGKPKEYIPKKPADKPAAKPAEKESASPVEYSRPGQEEIAVRISESKEISGMFADLQQILGRTIGYDGQCTFLLLHDRFGLPPEVIYMLADYCVKNGKSGYSYIEAVGKNWAHDEIDTVEKAAEKIESLGKTEQFWKKFLLATSLKNPKPTQKQLPYLEKWLYRQKMSFEMILKAYEEMADHTGGISFAYMDKVIDGWFASGFTSVNEVENAKKTKAEARSAAADSSASYNLDNFVKNSINNKPVYKRKKKK